jgi:antitoxin (DNA-binding transcriptional repressor) of toxin-antitoxin stability system
MATKTSIPHHIGVREFRDKASHYLGKGEPLAIERHGEVIGYYIPVKRPDPEVTKRHLEAFEAALAGFLAKTGLSEAALADDLIISREAGR